jgi:type II secretory pathway component GspD/PulD (secretin)
VNKGTIVTKGDLEFSALTLVFDFLKKQTDTRYLARPRILTLNNETAEIKITTNETVGVNSTVITGASSSNAVSAERAETGITLRVTPQVNPETGEITMFVAPKVKDVSKSVFTNSNQYYYDPEERSTKSLVRIKDGETVIIGGLIRHDKNESVTKLPFLGDIPLLGAAFRNRDKTKDKERELLVFITPRIVKEDASGAQIRQAKNSNIPLREQSVSPLIDRQAVISRYMNNAEGKH